MKKLNLISRGLLLILLVAAFASCSKEKQECPGSSQKQYNLSGFRRVRAGESFKITIVKGDAFSIKANGCAADLADLDLNVEVDEGLDIKYKRYRNKRYRVDFTITMPKLNSVALSGVAEAKVTGFQGQSSVTRYLLSGESIADVSGASVNVNFDISGNSKLTIAGNTENLYGSISGNGQLHSYNLNTKEADLEVDGNGKAYVMPWDILYATVGGNGSLYYKNSPKTNLQVSGNGKVIQE